MVDVLDMLGAAFIMMGFLVCSFKIYETDKKIEKLYDYISNKELKEIKK